MTDDSQAQEAKSSAKRKNIARTIDIKFARIRSIESEIDKLAKVFIPEFHFLNHKVSWFWDCDQSPIGKCVWDISERGFHIDCCCHYCGDPVERK